MSTWTEVVNVQKYLEGFIPVYQNKETQPFGPEVFLVPDRGPGVPYSHPTPPFSLNVSDTDSTDIQQSIHDRRLLSPGVTLLRVLISLLTLTDRSLSDPTALYNHFIQFLTFLNL